MDTSVVLIIFNRPGPTARLITALAEVKPSRIYVISDGPRDTREADRDLVEKTRALIDRNIDWPCTVQKNYAAKNMGCGRRVASGLNWVFEQEEMAIILEDDCIPNRSFFDFCQHMLQRYRDNPAVMHVSGSNAQTSFSSVAGGYDYSVYPNVWGWATWRRAWVKYDYFCDYKKRTKVIYDTVFSWREFWFWFDAFAEVNRGGLDTWDRQWQWTCWKHKGLCVVPSQNLIENIGFGPDATHTPGENFRQIPAERLDPPYQGPSALVPNRKRDKVRGQAEFTPEFSYLIKKNCPDFVRKGWRAIGRLRRSHKRE